MSLVLLERTEQTTDSLGSRSFVRRARHRADVGRFRLSRVTPSGEFKLEARGSTADHRMLWLSLATGADRAAPRVERVSIEDLGEAGYRVLQPVPVEITRVATGDFEASFREANIANIRERPGRRVSGAPGRDPGDLRRAPRGAESRAGTPLSSAASSSRTLARRSPLFTADSALAIANKLEAEISEGRKHTNAVVRIDGTYIGRFGIRRDSNTGHDYIPRQILRHDAGGAGLGSLHPLQVRLREGPEGTRKAAPGFRTRWSSDTGRRSRGSPPFCTPTALKGQGGARPDPRTIVARPALRSREPRRWPLGRPADRRNGVLHRRPSGSCVAAPRVVGCGGLDVADVGADLRLGALVLGPPLAAPVLRQLGPGSMRHSVDVAATDCPWRRNSSP